MDDDLVRADDRGDGRRLGDVRIEGRDERELGRRGRGDVDDRAGRQVHGGRAVGEHRAAGGADAGPFERAFEQDDDGLLALGRDDLDGRVRGERVQVEAHLAAAVRAPFGGDHDRFERTPTACGLPGSGSG